MVKLHHHPQPTKHPVDRSTKLTGAQILSSSATDPHINEGDESGKKLEHMKRIRRSASADEMKIIRYPAALLQGYKRISFFLAVILVIILGIFSIVYSFKKADTVESFSIYKYMKEKLSTVDSK